ncbi:MAG TPA: 23S rRNA (pseudouridine(1915)-N(3))-methyltransferase RlmH, partial [Salinimicrobium sp.]|nr:23S rRNA (pseudouridine(1915)-N(3))-methyltransferase RlmH [Salinimicrobium sp.]
MNIKFLVVGKTDNGQLQALTDDYIKRLGHYIKFETEVIPASKKLKSTGL